jgi:3-oxocholest-4-en-26-oyl-CoA dehydrogenase beta subunit
VDIAFSEDQRVMKDAARKFLDKECGPAVVRAIREGDREMGAGVWAAMADLGWLGLPFNAAYGGLEVDLVTLAALVEELGRVADPTPFINTVVACGLLIQNYANEELKARLLSGIASGSLHISLAVVEDDALYCANSIGLTATEQGDTLKLNGHKMFVENAASVDYLLVAVRTREEESGISLVLVDPQQQGVDITALQSVTLADLSEVKFSDVCVGTDQLVGARDAAWSAIDSAVKTAAAVQCAAAVGGAGKVLDMAVSHAKDRHQFDSPIGSFQAVQHLLANMYGDVETAWLAAYEAIAAIDQGSNDTSSKIALAKSFCNEAFTQTCLDAHQVFGGMGYLWETDLHFWTRKAKEIELSWGTPLSYRRALAETL